MSKFVGLKNEAKKVLRGVERLDSNRMHGRKRLGKWKLTDKKNQVGEINEVVQIIEDGKVFTNLEFSMKDGDYYVFDWNEEERKSIKK